MSSRCFQYRNGVFFCSRCWSYVGRRGGRQDLSLRPPDPDGKKCHCLCDVGRTLHEVMHALGFYHEHSRPDRDKFIQIIQENVKKGKKKQTARNPCQKPGQVGLPRLRRVKESWSAHFR